MEIENKKTKILTFLFVMFVIVSPCQSQSKGPRGTAEDKLGWKLSAGAWNFKNFTFVETINKIDSCGVKYVEAYQGQVLGGDFNGIMDFHMNKATRDRILEKLKQKNIKFTAFGVITPKAEEDWFKLFEFAKAMGVLTITSEPEEKFMPLLSKLCDQYNINIAIHNHTDPSHYWNPESILAAIKGQSKRIGACADIAHWVQSSLDPVECLKKLEGHVLHLHMADLNVKNHKDAHSVPWGTGVVDVKGIISELKRQNFKGIISSEYEYNWNNSVPDVTSSIVYFRKLIE